MTAGPTELAAFAAAEFADWTGLPAAARLDDLAALRPAPEARGAGLTGDPPVTRHWIPCYSTVYLEGLRIWVDGDDVLLLEGSYPTGPDGGLLPAPDLGRPDAIFDSVLGMLTLAGGEQVFAARGLALRVNPANGVLLGARGFRPTTVEDYRSRLRPGLEPLRPLVGWSA